MTKQDNIVAREMFAKAIALDPSYARAYASLALTHHFDLYMEFTDSRADSLAEMQEAARKAVALDGADAAGHAMSSRAAVWVGDYERAISDAQRSLELNPSGVDGNIALGAALDFSGRSHAAIPYYERVLQLSPLYPHTDVFRTMLARAQVNIGEYEAAIHSAKQAIEARPSYLEAHLVLAAALARLGRGPEAADAYRNAKELRPQGVGLPASWTRYGGPSGSQPLVDGLRKAGWEG
jgi:adenylate cyclase